MGNVNYLFARVVVRVQLLWGSELEEAWCGSGQQSCGRDRPGWRWPVTNVVRVKMFGVDQLTLAGCQNWKRIDFMTSS